MARILIVEDETDLANLYRVSLLKRGHEVAGIFDDPMEALRAEGSVDLILLDERLNGLSGTASIPSLRAAWPDAVIVLATADPEVVAHARELGATEVQRKPFSVRQLLDRIDQILAPGA
jgi:DNA-binding response OmpR family regulator